MTRLSPERLDLLGSSDKMREVQRLIARVADTDVTVLIRGEKGTGKALVARAIHDASPRRDKSFVKVTCAGVPPEMLESELFGFERGAFTGAIQHKPGKFEFANHGTMFLGEIDEAHAALQSKLLRVLQDGEFARLGGRNHLRVDVRLLAATSRDLEAAVADGRFREDLYFRLNVVCITLPPLRQRREEIPALTERFIDEYSKQYNKPPLALGRDTLLLFDQYGWPGNVRELEHTIRLAVILGSDETIRRRLAEAVEGRTRPPGPIPALQPAAVAAPEQAASDPAPHFGAPATAPSTGSLKDIARQAARGAEREVIFHTLRHTRWNRRAAAEILGISYKALLYKIKGSDPGKASS